MIRYLRLLSGFLLQLLHKTQQNNNNNNEKIIKKGKNPRNIGIRIVDIKVEEKAQALNPTG